jgi:DNA-binding CsgD family transcriptional regulator
MIAAILGVTFERATQLCEAGVFASAKKNRGSLWTADKNDVLEYKRLIDKEPSPGKKKGKASARRESKNAVEEKLSPFLGKMCDSAVARLAGVSRQTVIKYRKKADISNKRITVRWEDFDALLGKAPDKEIAERAGCSVNAVHNRRKKLKIPSFDKWGAIDGLLKNMSDAEIAGELGCSPETVRERRKLNKISSPRKPAPWHERKSADVPKTGADKTTNDVGDDLSRYVTIDMLIAMREKENGPR